MANSLYQELNNSSNNQRPIYSNNPTINLAAQRNPQFAQILKEVKQTGMNPKALFYKRAEEMGVDPNQVLQQISNMNPNYILGQIMNSI